MRFDPITRGAADAVARHPEGSHEAAVARLQLRDLLEQRGLGPFDAYFQALFLEGFARAHWLAVV